MAKETRKMIREDPQTYYASEVEKLIENHKEIKCLQRIGKRHIIVLKNRTGRVINILDKMIEETER